MAHRGSLSIAKGQWSWMDIIDEPVRRRDTSPGSMKGASSFKTELVRLWK
jgi:hypothetical protein